MGLNAPLFKAGISHLSLDDQARQERPHKLLDLEFFKNAGQYRVPAQGRRIIRAPLPASTLDFSYFTLLKRVGRTGKLIKKQLFRGTKISSFMPFFGQVENKAA